MKCKSATLRVLVLLGAGTLVLAGSNGAKLPSDATGKFYEEEMEVGTGETYMEGGQHKMDATPTGGSEIHLTYDPDDQMYHDDADTDRALCFQTTLTPGEWEYDWKYLGTPGSTGVYEED